MRKRQMVHWDPIDNGDGTFLAPLSRGLFARIDGSDLELLLPRKWSAHNFGGGTKQYAHNRRVGMMHRLIMAPPADLFVDHIDGDGLNNTRANLRIATRAQNYANTPVRGARLRGACRNLSSMASPWTASISVDGKRRYLGVFATERAAHEAWLAEARRVYGDFLPPELRP